jgi:hypothetical protein
VNKKMLPRNKGMRVRLQPPARKVGITLESDWIISDVRDESVELKHDETGSRVVIGTDAVRTFLSDPHRDTDSQQFGWLQLIVQLQISVDGSVDVVPLVQNALGEPQMSVLDTAQGQFVARRYRSLPLGMRAALAYLLFIGQATDTETADALRPVASLENGTLRKIEQSTHLIANVQPVDWHAVKVLGHEVPFMIKPTVKDVLDALVARDDELRPLMARLQ